MGAYEFQGPRQPAAAQNLGKVVVYPNPYKPNSGLGHNFGIRFGHPTDSTKRLTAKATIKIYNIAGELVRTLEETDGDGVFEWNPVINDNGEKLASGIYIYYITNPDNPKEKCVGKIGIIK